MRLGVQKPFKNALVSGTLHIVYTIYCPQYDLTLLDGLVLDDTPTLCLK